MKQEYQGAEATVKIGEKVTKDREKKNYRNPELDNRIRRDRNKQEINVLEKAGQNGVNAPEVLEESETSFKMEKIAGEMLKDVIEDEEDLVRGLAQQITRLHSADIIHGDITTSNAIVSEGEIYLIDFGLSTHSERIEDKAVDIHLLKQVLRASHTEELWNKFAEEYRKEGDEKVVNKVSEIEERARYK